MKVGDLVKLDRRNRMHFHNKVGIILNLKLGTEGKRKQSENIHMSIQQKASDPNLIATVVWGDGETTLMYIGVLEVISGSR